MYNQSEIKLFYKNNNITMSIKFIIKQKYKHGDIKK